MALDNILQDICEKAAHVAETRAAPVVRKLPERIFTHMDHRPRAYHSREYRAPGPGDLVILYDCRLVDEAEEHESLIVDWRGERVLDATRHKPDQPWSVAMASPARPWREALYSEWDAAEQIAEARFELEPPK